VFLHEYLRKQQSIGHRITKGERNPKVTEQFRKDRTHQRGISHVPKETMKQDNRVKHDKEYLEKEEEWRKDPRNDIHEISQKAEFIHYTTFFGSED
jgi:hypothetical protein